MMAPPITNPTDYGEYRPAMYHHATTPVPAEGSRHGCLSAGFNSCVSTLRLSDASNPRPDHFSATHTLLIDNVRFGNAH